MNLEQSSAVSVSVLVLLEVLIMELSGEILITCVA